MYTMERRLKFWEYFPFYVNILLSHKTDWQFVLVLSISIVIANFKSIFFLSVDGNAKLQREKIYHINQVGTIQLFIIICCSKYLGLTSLCNHRIQLHNNNMLQLGSHISVEIVTFLENLHYLNSNFFFWFDLIILGKRN